MNPEDITTDKKQAKMKAAEIFRTGDGAHLSSIEMLTLILAYTNVKEDLSQLAQRLIGRFGSYRTVFSASPSELERIPGMTKNAAALLVTLGGLHRCMITQSITSIGRSIKDIASEFYKVIGYSGREELWIAGFSKNGVLRAMKCLRYGTVTSVEIELELIKDYARNTGYRRIAVAHNHPQHSHDAGNGADINAAYVLANELLAEGISLDEYIIFDAVTYIYRFIVEE